MLDGHIAARVVNHAPLRRAIERARRLHLDNQRSISLDRGPRLAVRSFDSRRQALNTTEELNMRAIVLVKANELTEAGQMPTTDMLTRMNAFNEQLVDAGVMQAGEGLHPSAKGKRIRFSGTTPTVLDGPFPNAKDLVAGFWIWKVRSMDEAVQWLKKAPFDKGAEVEIRPIFETEDFGDELTPELRAQEERLRATAASNR
jgi:hypothetical protein